MKTEDRQAFVEVVLGFAELKGRQLSVPAIELYWRAMNHWPLADFRKAASHLLRTCEFMPTPKDFEDLRKAGRPTTAEAWVRALGSTSSAWTPQGYFGGTSGDPLIDRAVRAIGGYAVIAQTDEDKLHFLERRFSEAYEDMQDATEIRIALPQLTATKSARLTGPVQIGNQLEIEP